MTRAGAEALFLRLPELGARCVGTAESLIASSGRHRPAVEEPRHGETVEQLRCALGDARFSAERAAGAAANPLDVVRAMGAALETAALRASPTHGNLEHH